MTMHPLMFVPKSDFDRVLSLGLSGDTTVRLFADMCRLNVLYMVAAAGSGHIGTSFSCLELVSWLHLNIIGPESDGDSIYFSSKGHDAPALYAVLTALGRLDFDAVHRFRRLGGLPGHPDVRTPYMHANTGSLGMGISKAKGMIRANRLRRRVQSVTVMTGDGELQEGQFWESLQSASNENMAELTVVIDRNLIQSDTWVADVSDLGDLPRKLESFGWWVTTVDGHDPHAIAGAFASAAGAREQPKVLIAKTCKGFGVGFMSKMDQPFYRYHSGAPTPDEYLAACQEIGARVDSRLVENGVAPLDLRSVPRPASAAAGAGAQHLVRAYGRALRAVGEERPDVVVLDADLLVDCGLTEFRTAYPERFFECGIAEQDMVSQAGGMALSGLTPIVHSFASFLTARANEQIYNNATEGTKVIYVGSLAGIVPGMPGHSHQAVRDVASMAGIPAFTAIEPCNEDETALALRWSVFRAPGSVYLRLVSVPTEVPFALPSSYRLELGRGIALRSGADAVAIAAGPVLLAGLMRAAATLQREDGLELGVINLPWLDQVDGDWLEAALVGYQRLLCLENHYAGVGQASVVLRTLAERRLSLNAVVRGIDRLPECGQNAEVLAAHELDEAGICRTVRALCRGA